MKRKKPITLVCVICGQPFTRYLCGTSQTCSRVCQNALIQRKRQTQDMTARIKWHDLTCAVCGKIFRQTGQQKQNSQRQTCSARCERRFRRDAARKNYEARPTDVRDRIQAASIAAIKCSPRLGGFETNIHAKTWRLISPDHTVYHFRNLALFLREHAELFDPDDLTPRTIGCRATAHLSRLRPERRDRRKRWKGWEWDD